MRKDAAAREAVIRGLRSQEAFSRRQMERLMADVNERLSHGGFPDPILIGFRRWGWLKQTKAGWPIGEVGTGHNGEFDTSATVYLLSNGRIGSGCPPGKVASWCDTIYPRSWILSRPHFAHGLRTLLGE